MYNELQDVDLIIVLSLMSSQALKKYLDEKLQ